MPDLTTVRLLTPAEYHRTPWKNGKGWTDDVLLLPEGTGHDDFDIRISLAPIDQEGPFSSFPGIDRTITRLSRTPLALDFEGTGIVELAKLEPVSFDSVLAPRSVLPAGGEARVLNVMTRRTVWRSKVQTIIGALERRYDLKSGDMLALYVAQGSATFMCRGEARSVHPGQTLIAPGSEGLSVVGVDDCEAVLAILSPDDGTR